MVTISQCSRRRSRNDGFLSSSAFGGGASVLRSFGGGNCSGRGTGSPGFSAEEPRSRVRASTALTSGKLILVLRTRTSLVPAHRRDPNVRNRRSHAKKAAVRAAFAESSEK